MTKELEALKVSNQLKDFVLKFVKNGLDRRFIHGSFDIIETELKRLEQAENCVFTSKEDVKKEHKVLEIIKKYLDCSIFIKQLEKHCDDKTIDLLKEVLL